MAEEANNENSVIMKRIENEIQPNVEEALLILIKQKKNNTMQLNIKKGQKKIWLGCMFLWGIVVLAIMVKTELTFNNRNYQKESVIEVIPQNDRPVVTKSQQDVHLDRINYDFSVNEAMICFKNYHRAITDKKLARAYNMLSPELKKHMGSEDSYASGYKTTIFSEVSDMQILEVDHNRVKLLYTLKSRDKDNGKIRNQLFEGRVVIIKIGNEWYIDEIVADKLKDYFDKHYDNRVDYNSSKNQAMICFKNYHRAITDKKLARAYNMLSPELKKHMGSEDSYASGYKTTIFSEVSDMQILEADHNRVKLLYTLKSRDKDNGKIRNQLFEGRVVIIKIGNEWYIDEIVADKVEDKIERI